MQNDNIYMDQPDVFSENIQQKLEGHEIPVDAACWDEIEARMIANKKKKVIPFWWWLSGGAAVAMLTLLLTIGSLFNSPTYISKTERKNIHTTGAISKDTVLSQATNINSTNEYPERATKHTKRQIAVNKSEIANSLANNQLANRDSTKQNTQPENSGDISVTNIQIAESTVKTQDSVSNISIKKYIPNTLVAVTTEETDKPKTKEGWLLAASVNQAGSTSLGNSSDFLFASDGKNYLSNAETNYTSIMTANDFEKIKYHSVLSVGLVLRKNLSPGISVESGLMYSYLFSSFEKNGFVSYDATLALHYLGIPVNLVGQIWKNNKWEFYISGGGMVEKGLRSIYTQNQHIGNQTITTTAETGITGFQWSLNGAVGVTYKLHRNIGIYLEPKVSYFFHNNQPVSARTEQPTVAGLTAGLRFQL
jgi:hypothetical protein